MELYRKSPDEIKKEEDLHRSYKDYGFKACPLYIKDETGANKDVWDLTDREIFQYVGECVRSFGGKVDATLNNSMKKVKLVIECWQQKHNASDKLVYKLLEATCKCDGPKSEVARDLTAPLVNKRYEEVRSAYHLLNGSWPSMQDCVDLLGNSLQHKAQSNNNEVEMNN